MESPILKELNKKQKEAVLDESKRLLVLAGAGSGKTKTIIQKILYLISQGVDPANILAITFTKNAADEMIDRLIISADTKNGNYEKLIKKKTNATERTRNRYEYINKYPWLKNITVKTFHSLCYHIMRNNGAKEFDNKFKMLVEKKFNDDIPDEKKAGLEPKHILESNLKELSEDIDYAIKLKRYIIDNYIDDYRIRMNAYGKAEYAKPYTCLDGNNVRSKSERMIADWLYRHNINYVYEPTVNLKDFDFKPDFYIPEADVYIEHVSNLSHDMTDKEKQFKITDKLLFKTFEPMTRDIAEFHKALERIIYPRINDNIEPKNAINFEIEFKKYHDKVKLFLTEVNKAIDMIKVENKDYKKICDAGLQDQHERVRTFYEIFGPLYEKYQNYCTNKSYLDFNDLVNKTVNLLRNHEDIKKFFQDKYQYILVDEFQDVNTLQVELIKEFLAKNTQLFCVGDDWQSIYGFRGSEVEYIVNFNKHFKKSKIKKFDINYRSNDIIVDASNELIKNNKFKIEKKIASLKKSGKKIYLYCANKEDQDGVATLVEKVEQLLENGYTKKDILILYRRSSKFKPYYFALRESNLLVQYKTMHAAKGLEAKVVFIIGLVGGFYGFPQVWEADRVFQVIKPANYDKLLEEERRLFYVALTRAKEELFLISELGNESQFICEIPGKFVDRDNFLALTFNETSEISCNSCKKGIQRNFIHCPYCGKNQHSEEEKAETQEVKEKEIPYMHKAKMERPNAYTKWTEEEEKKLLTLHKEGNSITEIASILNRKEGGIKSRLAKLGVEEDEDNEERSGEIFSLLKEWRLGVAREKKIPPYTVFHDSTLIEIAEELPLNKEQLLKISGVGEVKFESYGEELLNIVRNNTHLENPEAECPKCSKIVVIEEEDGNIFEGINIKCPYCKKKVSMNAEDIV